MPILQVYIVRLVFSRSQQLTNEVFWIDFSPATVFDALYRGPCEDALVAVGMAPVQCQLIEYYLAQLHVRLMLGKGTSRQIHEDNLSQRREMVGHINSMRTCLGCLRRSPQHPLSCGQSFCDSCVAGYGHPIEGAEYQYQIDHCILCQRPCNKLIKVLPPTAAVRALSIDGGGVRGFIPLRYLEHLQRFLGPQCPIQDLIDIAFGTSSGAYYIALSSRQSVNNWFQVDSRY